MAWSMLLARLPESGRAAIERVSKEGAAASPDDACEAFRIVASEAPALAPEARDTLLRVVTCPFLVVNFRSLRRVTHGERADGVGDAGPAVAQHGRDRARACRP